MTAFDVIGHNEEATPYKHILVSLKEQSHALRYTHNTKTWNLSAVTYALHLNDCMVLFEDLKRRWQGALPYKEAWDVDLNKWKNQVWSDANNANNNEVSGWQSLCDKDYARFIELSEGLVGGEIPLAPLLDFVEGKQSSLSQIIIDVANQLATLIRDIDRMLNESSEKAYQGLYDRLMKDYQKRYRESLHVVFQGGSQVSYDSWSASKSPKKLPEAIKKEITRLSKAMCDKPQTWKDLWEECYDEDRIEIDHEAVGRYVFHNRQTVIAKEYDVDDLLYTISMIEFLNEKLCEREPSSASLTESNIIFRTIVDGKTLDLSKIREFLKCYVVDKITYKYEWMAVYLFLKDKGMLEIDTLVQFANQMNQKGWFEDAKIKCTEDAIQDYKDMSFSKIDDYEYKEREF